MTESLTFGRWMKHLRVELDLTQEALAEAAGCAPQTIRTYESGARRPSRELAERLAEVLRVPVEQRMDFVHAARSAASPAPARRALVEHGHPRTSTQRTRASGGSRGEPATEQAPILATKLYVPRPRADVVPRPRLLARLDAGLHGLLTVVAAPAGFGKTTLLSEWIHHSLDGSRAVAWLSLDPADRDPLQFLRYLVAAIQTVAPAVGRSAVALLQSAQPPPLEAMLTVLLNELVALPQPCVVVLDDYHVLRFAAIHQAMTFLLDHLPPQLHLVIATREDPPLPLHRLRVRRQVNELRAVDLRFTPDEAATFLREVMRLPLSSQDVAALEAHTEGWIAGLQLAALAMRDRTDFSGFVQAFTGSNRFVVDYLVPEVLDRLPPHLQTFVLQTAILDRMCAPLCDAVIGAHEAGSGGQPIAGSQSRMLLAELERMNLFLVPLDDERGWYRYHHLFAEVVRGRLLSDRSPEEVATLHRRASAWFEAQDLVVEAVRHVLAAGDLERTTSIVEERGMLLLLQGRLQQVTEWLDALPDALIRGRPVLSLVRAVAFMFGNRLAEVEPYLQAAEGWIQPDTPDDQARTIRGTAAVVRANVRYFVGDLPSVMTLIQEALNLLPETEVSALPGKLVTIFRSAAQTFTVLTFRVTGDVSPASERSVADVIAPARASGNFAATLYSIIYLALLRVCQGRLRAAAATYAEAAQLAAEVGGMHFLVGSPSYYIGLADLLRERNDLDAAEEYLRQGMGFGCDTTTMDENAATQGSIASPDSRRSAAADQRLDANVATHGYIAQARLQQARGASQCARETLEKFVPLARERGFFHVLIARGAAAQAELMLAQGDLAAATRWAETSGLGVDDELAFFRESEYLALVRVYIAQGRINPAGSSVRDALHLLARLLQTAEAGARIGSVIEILILRALALQAQGDRTSALTALERALTLAAPEGYVRIFVDEGAPMAALLVQGLGVGGWGLGAGQSSHEVGAYAHRLLAVFQAEGRARDAVSQRPAPDSRLPPPDVELLTERELEVLRLLVQGRSNQAIAQELIVAVGTVKRHVNSILSKLQVQSRLEAVARARDLDLV